MRTRRASTTLAATVVAVTMAGAGLAFACTASPAIISVSPVGELSPNAGANSGSPGSTVSVQGNAVAAGAPVEVRWNAVDGPVIGVGTAASSGKFDVVATVPEATPGVYYLVAAVGDTGVARSAFEVIPAPGAVSSAPASPTVWREATAVTPATTSASTGLAVGLLATGLVALFAGIAVATVRRRPVAGYAHR